MSPAGARTGTLPPIPGAPDDASIPLLTERLTLPPLELDTTLPRDLADDFSLPGPMPEAAPALPPVAAPAAFAEPAPPLMAPTFELELPAPPPAPRASVDPPSAGANWTRIEVELRESILNEVAQSLPQEVDAIVRNHMGEAIDRLVRQLADEARLAVAASLRDIVDHAVHSELERLRERKR